MEGLLGLLKCLLYPATKMKSIETYNILLIKQSIIWYPACQLIESVYAHMLPNDYNYARM